MRKLLTIPIGFVCAVPVLAWLITAYQPNPSDYAPATYARSLADFDQRVAAFQTATPPRTVLVGPSYAAILGEWGTISNLGSVGATPHETAAILYAYCDPSDRIIYALTPWDYLLGSTLARPAASNVVRRRLFLLHEHLSPSPPRINHPWSASNINAIPVSDAEFSAVRRAIVASNRDIAPDGIAMYIKKARFFKEMAVRAFPDGWEPDLSIYHKLHQRFPGIEFVLFPCIPLGPLPDDNLEIAQTINRLINAKSRLHHAFVESDLPMLDYSEPSSMRDLFHSTESGNTSLRAQLLVYLQTS